MRIVEATLVCHVSPMGGTVLWDDLPIGKRYRIDVDSIELGWRVYAGGRRRMREEMVFDVEEGQWLPTGVLSFYA